VRRWRGPGRRVPPGGHPGRDIAAAQRRGRRGSGSHHGGGGGPWGMGAPLGWNGSERILPPPTPPHPQRDWTATDRTAACGRRVRMPCVYRKHPKAGERTVAKASNTDHSNHQRINCCECEGVGPLATTHWPDVLLLWFDLSELLA